MVLVCLKLMLLLLCEIEMMFFCVMFFVWCVREMCGVCVVMCLKCV